MGFYSDRVVPHLTNLAMRNHRLMPYRERVISAARGRVLEVGIGSGLNLPLYSRDVDYVIGLDPSSRLLAMAGQVDRSEARRVELVEGSAEAIPLDGGSVDTVVTTWTLCSIPDALSALDDMRRVLRSAGRLLFVEHGRAPDSHVVWWQDRLTPAWKCLGGGCHLNRAIAKLIEDGGFVLERLETGYMRGPKPMTFMYEGSARPR
jgi:ubiquinone/menaquinone biosynthesis C-methylase UbiE